MMESNYKALKLAVLLLSIWILMMSVALFMEHRRADEILALQRALASTLKNCPR